MRIPVLVVLLITTQAVNAAPVPPVETVEQYQSRFAQATTAPRLIDAAPGASIISDDGEGVVMSISLDGGDEQISRLIRLSHSAVVWRARRGNPVSAWLISWKWKGVLIGPQFRLGAGTDARSAEEWFDTAAYNGSSEAGLIELARWCRLGGSYHAAKICHAIKKAAVDRMLWDRAGQP